MAAKAERRDQLAGIETYGSTIRGLLSQYDQLRSDTQSWSDGADNTTYDEAYAYLSEGTQKRQAIKDSMSSLTPPDSVSQSHSTMVGLLDSLSALCRGLLTA